ncbi:hypothetical protein [Elizabethkingia occulta]|uniref:hypothetical protein n=1 Tax=Elizabethkingia occulta TaxID=1867263 RepID=UPI00398C3B22
MVNTKTIIKPPFQAAYFIKHIIFTLIRARRKVISGNISLDLSDLKIGGDFKLFKALHIGTEVNVGEAVKRVINTQKW